MRCWFVTLPLLISVGCQNASSDIGRREVACKVIEDFVADEFRKATKPLSVGQISRFVSREQAGEPASKDRRDRALADECPGLASLIEERGFKSEVISNPSEAAEDRLFYAHDTLAITLPVVSEDGEQATFKASRVCGPRCGSGSLVTYKRSLSGAWVKEGEKTLWIS